MSFEIAPVDVWVGEIEDRPGRLSSKLAHIMMSAGANLEFVVARPSHEHSGSGVLFLAPISGPDQSRAAHEVGLHKSDEMHVLRLCGPDRSGLAAGLAGTLAQAEINITGLTAAAVGDRALLYVRFATRDELQAAREALTSVLCGEAENAS